MLRRLALALVLALAPAFAVASAPDAPDAWEAAVVQPWDEVTEEWRWGFASERLGPSDEADWFAWAPAADDAVTLDLTWFFAPEDGIIEVRGEDGAVLSRIGTDDLGSSLIRRSWRGAPGETVWIGVLSASGDTDRYHLDVLAVPERDFAVVDVRFGGLDAPQRVFVDVAVPADSARIARELRIETPVSNLGLASTVVAGSASGGLATYAIDLDVPLPQVRAQLTGHEADGHPENDARVASRFG